MGFDLTPQSLKKLCKELKLYASCPELNEVLYLHQKGIVKLKHLDAYIGLRTLHLECNAISIIEGLENCVDLRCLYINQNLVEHIQGLENLKLLDSIDLSDNQIKHVHGLSCCPLLRQLNLSGNFIRTEDDVSHLIDCKNLESLDISKNKIDNEESLKVLRSLPLRLLRLNGNPIVTSTKFYRKTTITSMPTLNYLDESPVFEKERRLAQAWLHGGIEAEKNMRETIRLEEAVEREAHRRAFEEMVNKAKTEAAAWIEATGKEQQQRSCSPLHNDPEQKEELNEETENMKDAQSVSLDEVLYECKSKDLRNAVPDANIRDETTHNIEEPLSKPKIMDSNKRNSGSVDPQDATPPRKLTKLTLDYPDPKETCKSPTRVLMELDQNQERSAQSTTLESRIQADCNTNERRANVSASNNMQDICCNTLTREATGGAENLCTDWEMNGNAMGEGVLEEEGPSRERIEEGEGMNALERESDGSRRAMERERVFKEEMKEGALRRAAAEAEGDSRYKKIWVNSMYFDDEEREEEEKEEEDREEASRPVIWGTPKYKDLWSKASSINYSEDSILQNTSQEIDPPLVVTPDHGLPSGMEIDYPTNLDL